MYSLHGTVNKLYDQDISSNELYPQQHLWPILLNLKNKRVKDFTATMQDCISFNIILIVGIIFWASIKKT